MKVAGYCRVSTEKEDQSNSFESQKRFFQEYIARDPQWELFDIYADEGITGTSTRKRTHFNRMIRDAYCDKFQMIITKEVSRFSRNILDTICYTRELKAIGVSVLFLNDGINTSSPDSELRLSIMASIAQEESRKTSERVVWGQTRQMERGIVFGRSLLGYDVENGKIQVNPMGAELVKLIFYMYGMEQMSTSEIAKYLSREGFFTYSGKQNWEAGTIIKILKNEKYIGHLIQRKTFTPDYLTHAKKQNTGQVPFICIKNHHEPIISDDLWNRVQVQLEKNTKCRKGNNGHSNRYAFSGKIMCGECGSCFVGRIKYLKDGTKKRRWCCGTVVKSGAEHCAVRKLVRDDDARQMFTEAVRCLQMDSDRICKNLLTLIQSVIQDEYGVRYITPEQLDREQGRILKKKETLIDSYFAGDIKRDEMLIMKKRYDNELETLKKQCRNAEDQGKEMIQRIKTIQENVVAILNGEIWSDSFCKNLLHSLTVFQDKHIELRLKCSSQVFCFSE